MITLACYNIKGGVGKTASAVNLAYLAALGGARTLLWDLDAQGAASFYFRVKARVKGGSRGLLRRKRKLEAAIKATDYPRLDLLPADFSYRNLDLLLQQQRKPGTRLRKLIKPLRGDYDYLFLDCPPGITLASENVFAAADALLVPTIPTTLALRTLEQLAAFCGDQGYPGLRLLPFFSMVDRRKQLQREIVARPDGLLKKPALGSIPYATEVEQMGLRRAPLETFGRAGAAATAYRQLWAQLQRALASP